jgi:ligand-binding sensor domain-containing protein/signal transduction histidine kinase
MAQIRNRLRPFRPLVFSSAVVSLYLLLVPPILAEQLSIRRYDLRDGLANSRVADIHQDAKGYLWFGTWEGLSRFDGYRFINYDTRDGLGHALINAITEDRQGHLWVATNGGGVSRLIDDPREAGSPKRDRPGQPRKNFVSFAVGMSPESNRVNAFVFDQDNNLWCATDGGLYRATLDPTGRPTFDVIVPREELATAMAALADSRGRLWFGIQEELIEVVQGQIIRYGPIPGGTVVDESGHPPPITSLVEDPRGRLFLAEGRSVLEFIEPQDPLGRGRWRGLHVHFEAGQGPFRMLADSNGILWIGTNKGLIRFKGQQTLYTTAQGLSDNVTRPIYEDREGNLWIGTGDSGVCKLTGETVISFTRTEGLPDQGVSRVIEDHQGRIYAVTNGGLVQITEGKAIAVEGSRTALLAYAIAARGIAFGVAPRGILQDHRGDWWFVTQLRLHRCRGPELQLGRGEIFGAREGLLDASIADIYEDPKGVLWVSTASRDLYYCDLNRSGRVAFERVPVATLLPPSGPMYWMVSDHSGTLWLGAQFGLNVGAQFGFIGRLKNGSVEVITPKEGLPETEPRALFVDSRGWLWIGQRNTGVSVTKDPTAENPEFVNYSTADGLASGIVVSIAEDDLGRIYLATSRGVDRFDPLSGKIRHFTTTDGLAGNAIAHCLKDTHGDIWITTSTGLSRFSPKSERVSTSAPPIYLSRIRVAGEDLPLPNTGTLRMSAGDFVASRNNLLIEFVGLDFSGERELKYQYKLEGADRDWSAPSDQQSVNYAQLAPGSYQFLVRAINREAIQSEPAVFAFRILRPIWQRWWFAVLAAILTWSVVYSVYRYRVKRLIELERVRTRIASDLHDDIGSNLSLIAGLSELLGQQARAVDLPMAERLSLIASVSRRSVDAMSDIVWAVDPRRDRVFDLALRMRRFASDSFTAHNIQFEFDGPDSERNIRLGAEVRREVFLVFKEAVNNTVRHSGCKRAEVMLDIDHRVMILKVSDNGCGFDQDLADHGQGLASMRRRAERLGGQFFVISSAGAGATVILKVPVGRGN